MLDMSEEQYWALVDEGPAEFSRDGRILFWWVIGLLPSLKRDGSIVCPNPAPLHSDDVKEVLERIVSAEQPLQQQEWRYEGQSVLVPTIDNELVTMRQGEIEITQLPT